MVFKAVLDLGEKWGEDGFSWAPLLHISSHTTPWQAEPKERHQQGHAVPQRLVLNLSFPVSTWHLKESRRMVQSPPAQCQDAQMNRCKRKRLVTSPPQDPNLILCHPQNWRSSVGLTDPTIQTFQCKRRNQCFYLRGGDWTITPSIHMTLIWFIKQHWIPILCQALGREWRVKSTGCLPSWSFCSGKRHSK